MIKIILKEALPSSIYDRLEKKWRVYKLKRRFKEAYYYDLERYIKFSDSKEEKSENNLIGLIIRRYHVIEKGLTMPGARLGFGKQVLSDLIRDCIQYVERFGVNEEQLIQAFAVIIEYKTFHEANGYSLDINLQENILKIESLANKQNCSNTSHQKIYTKSNYFKYSKADFSNFSKSRCSIRNYSEVAVPLEVVKQALELAKTAPSACNRQSWRTYVFTEKDIINKILEIQGGNRGFGHLTNKLIVVTANIGVFSGISERNQAFIDGGIYAMNLLYSLHYYEIAACILNCSNTVEKDKVLRKLCKINDSEVFIAFISCGNPPENFKAAASIRYSLEKTNTVI